MIRRSPISAISSFCSPTYWILLKQCDPYVTTFNTLSGVECCLWISPQLNILCTSAVKLCYGRALYEFQLLKFVYTEYLPPCSSDLNLVDFLLWGSLTQISRNLRHRRGQCFCWGCTLLFAEILTTFFNEMKYEIPQITPHRFPPNKNMTPPLWGVHSRPRGCTHNLPP